MKQQYLDQLLFKVKYGHQDSDRHVMTCFSIALQIHARRILELGVRTGNTTLPFLCAARELGGMVHSVDLDATTFQCPDDLRVYWQFFQSDAIAWLDQRSREAAQYDLIYIDDWHSYPHVRRELELIEPMVTPNTVILLHDLMYSGAHPDYRSDPGCQDPQWEAGGPYRAVAELDSDIWEWSTIPVNHGLTILRKKGRVIR
jgi:predicted O-methyltransferase YrrM